MFKRYRFVALMVFSYVFSCGIAGTACAENNLTGYAKQLILNGSLNMAFYVALDENDLTASTTETTFSINGKKQKIGHSTRMSASQVILILQMVRANLLKALKKPIR